MSLQTSVEPERGRHDHGAALVASSFGSTRGAEGSNHWIWLAAAFALACIGARSAATVLVAPHWAWNGARVVASAALARGLDIYPLPGTESTLSYIYGPVFALAYLPAAILSQPTAAIFGASTLALCYFWVPAIFVARATDAPLPMRVLVFACFAAVGFAVPGLRYSATSVHADAPLLGLLGAASLLWAEASRQGRTVRAFAIPAFLAVLAVWCKQVAAPALIGMVLWIWLGFGTRRAVAAFAVLAAIGVVVSALVVVCFGWRDLAFWMIRLPAAMPWRGTGSRIVKMARYVPELMQSLTPLVAVLVVAVLAAPDRRGHGLRGALRRWSRGPSSLLALEAAILIPVGLMARARGGGGQNSNSPALYLLSLAVTLALGSLVASAGEPKHATLVQRARTGIGLAVVVVGLCGLGDRDLWLTVSRAASSPSENPEQRAYEFARNHPGTVYFPWNPLAHVLAEGRVYHFEYGVIERAKAGLPMSAPEIAGGLPAHVELVAYEPRRQSEWMVQHVLTSYSVRAEVPALPGFTCYRRSIPASEDSGGVSRPPTASEAFSDVNSRR